MTVSAEEIVEKLEMKKSEIERLIKDFKPSNPIKAKKMPPVPNIKRVLRKMGETEQHWGFVWTRAESRVEKEIKGRIEQPVWDRVNFMIWDLIEQHIWLKAGDPAWEWFEEPYKDEGHEQVRIQVWISTWLAVKDLLGLDYEHPAFEMSRMGIIVIYDDSKFMVFGKKGKLLGEFPANLTISNNHLQI